MKKEVGEIDDEKEQASAELGFMFEAPDDESNEEDDEEGHSGVSDEVCWADNFYSLIDKKWGSKIPNMFFYKMELCSDMFWQAYTVRIPEYWTFTCSVVSIVLFWFYFVSFLYSE